jgi:uncharacterized protein (TIGR02757 family)
MRAMKIMKQLFSLPTLLYKKTCVILIIIRIMINKNNDEFILLNKLLRKLAQKYETKEFLVNDPSKFMHEVVGIVNQETLAFIASSLSFGSRKQFFPKIQYILDKSKGDVYSWITDDKFYNDIPNDDNCFYRLYTNHAMIQFLQAFKKLLIEYQSLGNYIKLNANDGISAIREITNFFSMQNIKTIIPQNTSSSCKRLCMFLRWMVRDGSPVDLGLWKEYIDKRTLIMPMDTHVMTEAINLGLLESRTASMSSAQKLTNEMKLFFPNDPLKGDFALFGYGVNKN